MCTQARRALSGSSRAVLGYLVGRIQHAATDETERRRLMDTALYLLHTGAVRFDGAGASA